MPWAEQPARKSYFFGKGFTDLRDTIRDSWGANHASGMSAFRRSGESFGEDFLHWFAGVFFVAAAIFVYVFGTAVFLITGTLHIVFLGCFFLCVYLLFSAFYLLERTVMLAYSVFVSCPDCHKPARLPHYRCPGCKEIHTELIPGPYGIFFRRCNCGRPLHTSFLTGRTGYEALCAECGSVIAHAETAPICIPVIGTPGSGKTCFLYSCAELTLNVIGPSRGWAITHADERTEADLTQLENLVSKGMYPRQTTSKHAQAFRLLIHTGSRSAKVLYLYDSAGEAFLDSDALESHHFYGYCHGFAAIIDARAMLNRREAKGSARSDPEDAFVRMLNAFEKSQKLRSDQTIRLPLAIVLNKADDPAVCRQLEILSYDPSAMTSDQCRDFLTQIGADHLVAIIDQRYKNARYFLISALRADSGKLVSTGIEEVSRWLLSQAHPALRKVAA